MPHTNKEWIFSLNNPTRQALFVSISRKKKIGWSRLTCPRPQLINYRGKSDSRFTWLQRLHSFYHTCLPSIPGNPLDEMYCSSFKKKRERQREKAIIWPKSRQEVPSNPQTIRLNHMTSLLDFFKAHKRGNFTSFSPMVYVLWMKITMKILFNRDSPGGLVVKNLTSNAGDTGSIPGWGTKIPNAVGWLSPCTATTEPSCNS